jgi:hypothetical protein
LRGVGRAASVYGRTGAGPSGGHCPPVGKPLQLHRCCWVLLRGIHAAVARVKLDCCVLCLCSGHTRLPPAHCLSV